MATRAYKGIIGSPLIDLNDPERDEALCQLASAYQRTGRPELPVSVYQDLLARLSLNKEQEVELLRGLAVSAQLSGQDGIRLAAFQRIIELGTNDWNIYQTYGVGLRES